jgi:hypothetical protein
MTTVPQTPAFYTRSNGALALSCRCMNWEQKILAGVGDFIGQNSLILKTGTRYRLPDTCGTAKTSTKDRCVIDIQSHPMLDRPARPFCNDCLSLLTDAAWPASYQHHVPLSP